MLKISTTFQCFTMLKISATFQCFTMLKISESFQQHPNNYFIRTQHPEHMVSGGV
jgi:hypothetical protein